MPFASIRLLLPFLALCVVAQSQLPYVNPFIGTGGHGHTYPGATAPFGMVQLSPDTRLGGWDGCSGYHYSDSLLYGFSHTHLSGTGVEDYCDVLFAPFTGAVPLENTEYASSFQKKREKAEAGYYSVFLDKFRIKAEMTATERVGVHRYTYPLNREKGGLVIDLRHRDEVLESSLRIVNSQEIEGSRISKSWAKNQHLYFVARFSTPFHNSMAIDMSSDPRVAEKSMRSKSIVGVLHFYHGNVPLVVTVGISGVSIEGARRNLEAECNHFDFDRVKSETQAKWQQQLSKIAVEGGTEAQKTAFYTALYHTMVVPNRWSDVDGQYRGRDNQVHQAKGHDVYSVFSLWDTYRACNPLYTLLEPGRTGDFVQTFLRQYEQGGLLPVWELSANETDCMIGNHAIPVIADAYLKGIRNYDAEKALEAMQTSANQDRYGLKWYRKLGYVPADQESESVSKTLEYAFDDWCIAQMAKSMGKTEVYNTYIRRAQYYKNLYDPSTGFFRAKANGSWYEPFNPFEVNFNYTEANAWQYRFAAPQDVAGMNALFSQGLNATLDSLFAATPKTAGRDQADMTGLVGQYVQGNEPSHHMAYLYTYGGQPWKTQERVRRIMDELYSPQPDGLSGNEDCGQMSAWYVFSAMGFYPVLPGSGQYAIGSPLFEKVTLHLADGKTFTLRAPGASARRPYVGSATLNGHPLDAGFLTHAQITGGASVVFEMSENPATGRVLSLPNSAIETPRIVPVPYLNGAERVFRDKQSLTLGCIDPQANIYYTVDGSIPDEKSTRYKKPFDIKSSLTLQAVAMRNGERSQVISAVFNKVRTDLSVLRYQTRYNPQYTARGDNGLIDGIRGAEDFRTGGWQGFEGVDLDVILDLGKKKTLKTLGAGFLQDENSWIFFPVKVRFEGSTDGVNFELLGEVDNTLDPLTKGVQLRDFSLPLSEAAARKKVRYLRVRGITPGKCPVGHKAAGYPCWIFADEILITE